MSTLEEIRSYLDGCFGLGMKADYPNALNGLQMENDGTVTKIGAAVDASESTLELAIKEGVNLLLVHHGLFWSGLRPITGVSYRKVKRMMEANLAVYSMHLPLDGHSEWGNSLLLGKELGLKEIELSFEQLGHQIGIVGTWDDSLSSLVSKLGHLLEEEVYIASFGPQDPVGKVAIISGGAGTEFESVYRQGVMTFITGEGAHWTVPSAEENDMNLIYAGHYATETFGVKAMAEHVAEKFDLPWVFLDNPTGL